MLKIGRFTVELHDPSLLPKDLTQSQTQTYWALIALQSVTNKVKFSSVMDILGLRIPETLVSRLEHLAEKGCLTLTVNEQLVAC